MSGICSVHSPKTTDPDCAACNAVTDTGPTPERRWTWTMTSNGVEPPSPGLTPTKEGE